ncbi:hypothetical protein M0802_003454 [Mischocyttarus mexicanus]|nr:hypothetical protein M0802_003454 [Mischocyttarus mexicanus]
MYKKYRFNEDVTLGPDTRKSIIPALLSSVNGTLGNSTSPLVESRRSSTIKEKKTTKDTLRDSTSKLLYSIKANSKGPFYQTSFNSNVKEQQDLNYDESMKSSVKRSLLRGPKDNDKFFLFYSRQKQPRHFPQLLLKTRVSNDINSKLLSNKKEIFLERDKRKKRKGNIKNSNDSRSSREVTKSKTLIGRLSNVKREIKEKNSHVRSADKANFEMLKVHEPTDNKFVSKKTKFDVRNRKNSRFPGKVIARKISVGGDLSNAKREREIEIEKSHVKSTDKASFPDLHKRKIGKRKRKMDVEEEIRKLTGIRRRKKKKKKKKKTKSQENTLDIPEAKSKWKLTKRNLLSIQEKSKIWKLTKRNLLNVPKIERDTKIDSSKMKRLSIRNLLSIQRNKKISESKVSKMREEMKKKKSESTFIRQGQSRTDGKQVRGGQDCSNRDQSLDVDESKYFASAHCLRFSDLWYSVYRLEEPILDQAVSLQLYERRSLPDGTTRWEDLTRSMIRLDTFSRRYINKDDTLALTYRARKEVSKEFPLTLDVKKDRLLIPSSVSTRKNFKISQSKDIFEEYLIVRASEISKDGNECDKVGVGFKAFVEQPNRCRRLEGTCLKNQPLSYWKHDREAREAGRAGCYFLSNFASVPSEAIKYNVSGSGSGEFLALEYHSPHVSAIDIEVRNDYNSVPSAGPFGRITQIYVDSISLIHTIVMIVIYNVGSTPSIYRTRIVNCPQGLPVSWTNVKSLVQIILPRQNRRIVFDLYGELPFNEFQCTGISKWIIGIYIPEVSRWGLDTLVETTKINEYFEDELKCKCIVYDESGFPVHPDTGSRSIRICSRKTEFLLNAVFFLIYPIAVCWYQSKKMFKKRLRSYSSDESRACLSSDKDEYENLVTVTTYGDSRNSKMEADDTNYVMNELKKSQESLQEYNRYKRYRYYMEGKNRNRND